MIRICLADDHEIMREGLARLLHDEPDFKVVGSAPDAQAALNLIQQLQPDIALIDLMMPGMNGIELTRLISTRVPRTRTIVLSMHADEAYVLEALNGGAMGYVLKESSRTDLVQAIHAVMEGQRYLSAPLSERAIHAYMERAKPRAADPYETLTGREREILRLLASGRTNAEVAALLAISPRTVETHRANLMDKLRLKNRAEMIRFAIQRGLVD